jgi:hypothetical protein
MFAGDFSDLRSTSYILENILMQSLLSQYKELEEKSMHHSDAAFHEDSEKMVLTA